MVPLLLPIFYAILSFLMLYIAFGDFALAYVTISGGLLSKFFSKLISTVSCLCLYLSVFYVPVFSSAMVFFLISSMRWFRFLLFLRESKAILLAVCISIVLGIFCFIISIACSALTTAISSARLFEHLSRSLCFNRYFKLFCMYIAVRDPTPCPFLLPSVNI